jgi:uncharacterized protein involved in exopolysaccharide biosynthesis
VVASHTDREVARLTQEQYEISISIHELVAFFVRGLVPAALMAALAASAAILLTQRQDLEFRAEATLLVGRATSGLSQFGLPPVTASVVDPNAYRDAAASD